MIEMELYPYDLLPGDRIFGVQLTVTGKPTPRTITGDYRDSAWGVAGAWDIPIGGDKPLTRDAQRKVRIFRPA